MRLFISVSMILISLFVLEHARQGVEITRFDVAQTPVTRYVARESDGPVVIIAHGFAGSQQMMQGYALPLARAGYRVFAFEFLGHGRHTEPMSGDVTVIEGTTRLLMDQTADVIDAVSEDGAPFALIGHSMATDVLVRVAAERSDVGPVVLISAFSEVIDATTPQSLLLITGAWEGTLRAFALEAAQMVTPIAAEGMTVSLEDVQRRAIAAPFAEHVSVLQSRTGRLETVSWLNGYYERDSSVTILPTGWAILGMLGGLVLMFRSVAAFLPARDFPQLHLSGRHFTAATLVPMALTPLIALPLTPSFLPVLVADYLALHLLVFGALQLALLRRWGMVFGRMHFDAFAMLLLWSALFGFLLDRYAANFWPTPGRVWIITAIAVGAVPYMLSDALLTANAGLLRRIMVRVAFLTSLGIAVAVDFEGLFFLVMIAPVLVLFYLVFGTMGRNAAQKSGPVPSGLALGLVLAWALGVSFPLFQS